MRSLGRGSLRYLEEPVEGHPLHDALGERVDLSEFVLRRESRGRLPYHREEAEDGPVDEPLGVILLLLRADRLNRKVL